MPTYTLTIDGQSIPQSNCIMPAKYNDHLDEQLDMATVSVFGVSTSVYKPFCKVSMTVTGATRTNNNEPTIVKYYRLMSDQAEESPVGTGKFRHNLTLIEETKYLEGFLVESLCVTNAGGRKYTQTTPTLYNLGGDGTLGLNIRGLDDLKTPSAISEQIRLPYFDDPPMGSMSGTITITYGDGTTSTATINANGSITPAYITLKNGSNNFYYSETTIVAGRESTSTGEFDIYGQPNYYPLKPWTYKEVIERVLELCEPRIWDSAAEDYVTPPRFAFRYNNPNDALEVALFNSLAPEFTFTRATLREILQQIGGALHKEPRLDNDNNVYFIDLGGQEQATYFSAKTNTTKPLNQYPYIKRTEGWELESSCTRLDAHVDNFVNQISFGDATTGQPFINGTQSLRTDSAYIRVNEETAIFPSVFPILKPDLFYWVDINGIAGTAGTRYDITAFLFEKSVYDSQLSNYSTAYPNSKAYGLYYTQGQAGIGGFFFENTEWSGGVFANPAIVNILRAVTGNNNINISPQSYATLCFELRYTPVYPARVQHGKSYTGDLLAFPRMVAHNQSANMVEAQYYGENIKGMAERMGNVEKSFTFQCKYTSTIPQAGQKWDDDYYISDVAVEIASACFKVTVGLTKNFNRKSKYIGANSYRRIFEVSERMVQERNSIYTDYLVIVPYSQSIPAAYGKDFLLTDLGWTSIVATFSQSAYVGSVPTARKVSAVKIQGQTKNGAETLPQVILPVVASAFGNVVEFSYKFKDNFSAGQKIVYQQNDNITGWYTSEVQYCDYYGRMYYENVEFVYKSDTTIDINPNEIPEYVLQNGVQYTDFGTTARTAEGYPIVCRKDSREALSGAYALEFVTTMSDFVVGSALASNNTMVAGINSSARPVLVILNSPINKLSRYVDLSSANVAATYNYGGASGNYDVILSIPTSTQARHIISAGVTATASGKAWAIVTPVYSGTSYTVEDEDGNTETYTPTYGGEIIVGQNAPVAVGDTIGRFRIVGAHDIFKFIEEANV